MTHAVKLQATTVQNEFFSLSFGQFSLFSLFCFSEGSFLLNRKQNSENLRKTYATKYLPPPVSFKDEQI